MKSKIKLLAIIGFSLGGAALAAEQASTATVVQNKESAAMQQMLRPYLDLEYNPPDGPDKDRPSIKENALKIAGALPPQLSAPVTAKRKVLVLTYKTHGLLHVPGAAGLIELFREAAKKFPAAFEFTESYTSEGIDANMLAKFDAVVVNNVGQTWGANEEKLYNQLIPEYVKNGGGFFAVHGTALLFPMKYLEKPGAADVEFDKMLGGFCTISSSLASMVHPKNSGKFNHCSPFAIKLVEPDNPLAAAFRGKPSSFTFKSCQLNGNKRSEWPVTFNPPKELADELYVISTESNQDHAARCIVSIDPDRVPKESFPGANDFSYSLIWIKNYGKGRVFYSQLGHNQAIFSVPCVARAMLDGLLFTTGDLKVPAASAAAKPKATENP